MVHSQSEINKQLSSFQNLEICVSSGMGITMSLAKDILQSGGSVPEEDLEALKSCMLQYAKMEEKFRTFMNAAEHGAKEIHRASDDSKMALYADIDKKLTKISTEDKGDEHAKKHKKYLDLCTFIGESVDAAPEEGENLDEDCVFSATSRTCRIPIDPLTQVEIKDPVKNRHCGHTYDRASIIQYVKSKKNARCPQIACANRLPLCIEDLVENLQVLRLIRKKSGEKP